MSLREEQCKKVCRILDNVLANRPTERDSLIVAVRKAFAELQERKTGKWIRLDKDNMFFVPHMYKCSVCGNILDTHGVNAGRGDANFCPNCGAKMEVEHEDR